MKEKRKKKEGLEWKGGGQACGAMGCDVTKDWKEKKRELATCRGESHSH